MLAGFSVLFVLLCGLATRLALRSPAIADAEDDELSRFMKGIVIFFAVFFGAFHVLGFINLATDLAVVSTPFACAVLFLPLAGLAIRGREGRAALVTASTSPSEFRAFLTQVTKGESRLISIAATSTVAVIGCLGVMLTTMYPLGYEAVAYHIPIAVQILQDQTLRFWDTAFAHTYSANGSIYFSFFLNFVSARLLPAANLLLLIPLFLATYKLGLATGADKDASRIASLGLITVPFLFAPTIIVEADTSGAAFLALAACFTITSRNGPTLSAVFLAGIAAGLAYGFKQLYALGVLSLLVIIIVGSFGGPATDAGESRIRRIWRPAAMFLLGAFATASFWMIRSYTELGNPFYPVHIAGVFDLLGWPKAPDYDYLAMRDLQFKYVRSPLEWIVFPWVEWHSKGLSAVLERNGTGLFFTATVPVAILASTVGAIFYRTRRRVIFSLLGGSALILIGWWYLNAREPRYTIGAVVMLVPLVAWTISQAKGKYRTYYDVLVSTTVFIMLAITFSVLIIMVGDRIVYSKMYTRHSFYEYPEKIDQLPPNSKIMNLAGRTENYPLYGASHLNRVVSHLDAINRFVVGGNLELRWNMDWVAESVGFTLIASRLRESGVTHIYTAGLPSLSFVGCAAVKEIDRLEFNPVNGVRMPRPFSLYEITYCDEQQG